MRLRVLLPERRPDGGTVSGLRPESREHVLDCVCSYCVRNRALRAALARLDKEQLLEQATPGPWEYEPHSDAGYRFDPFCHILDDQQHALCLADISGRRIHPRNLGTSSSAAPTHCPVCQRAICPTCLEAERHLYGVPS